MAKNKFWTFKSVKGNNKVALTSTTPTAIIDGYIHKNNDLIWCNIYCLIVANTGGTQNTVDITDGVTKITVDVPANDTRVVQVPREDSIEVSNGNTEWVATLRANGSMEITSLFVRN